MLLLCLLVVVLHLPYLRHMGRGGLVGGEVGLSDRFGLSDGFRGGGSFV